MSLVLVLLLMVGAQAAYACDEPVLKKIASAESGGKSKVKVTHVTPGTEYLLRVDGVDRAANTVQADRITTPFDMLDYGPEQRKIWVEVVLANDQCENSPWKLTRQVRYTGNGTPVPADPTTAAGTPVAPPIAAAPVVKPPKIPKPKPLPKIPTEPPSDTRIWASATEASTRSLDKLKQPKLPRSVLPVDAANSTHALVGLGILFVLIAIATATALILLNRKDAALNTDTEDGRLPSHLDVSDITAAGNAAPGAVGATLAASDPQAVAGSSIATLPEDGAVQEEQEGEPPRLIAAAAAADATEAAQAVADAEITEQQAVEAVPAGAEGPTEVLAGAAAPVVAAAATNGNGGHGHAGENGVGGDNGHVNGNGHADGNGHAQAHGRRGGRFDVVFQNMLDDDAVQHELRSIVAGAREQAERQGVEVDREQILHALTRVAQVAGGLSEPAKAKLISRFEQIITEELERVPQVHS